MKTKKEKKELLIVAIIVTLLTAFLFVVTGILFIYIIGDYDIYTTYKKVLSCLDLLIMLAAIYCSSATSKAWNQLLGKKKNKNRV